MRPYRYPEPVTDAAAEAHKSSLRRQFDQRKAEIRAMEDKAQAVREAARLGDEMAAFRSEAARLRSEIAAQMRAEDNLTIQELADRLHVHKATAQQILDTSAKGPRKRSRRRAAPGASERAPGE